MSSVSFNREKLWKTHPLIAFSYIEKFIFWTATPLGQNVY